MFKRSLAVLLVLIPISSFMIACGRKEGTQLDPVHLLSVAREYGASNRSASVVSAVPSSGDPHSAGPDTRQTEAHYVRQVTATFNDWDWDQLEKAAHEARVTKARVEGGAWKLFSFYDAVAIPTPPEGALNTDADWVNRLQALQQWAAAKPQSSTALIATAWAYVAYGGYARGSGYANTVTEEGWKLQAQRVAQASALLAQAARLKEKCPFWYEVMQNVALDQGWTKSEEKELLDLAVRFQPDYYHFYREHANYLLPKWYGDDGDTEAFAEELSARIGGREGEFLYFEIGSMLACQCDADRNSLDGLSWPRLKQGYATLSELYGVSNRKANRFAMMAYLEKDRLAAQAAFERIGTDWDSTVWNSKKAFDNAKSWATSSDPAL